MWASKGAKVSAEPFFHNERRDTIVSTVLTMAKLPNGKRTFILRSDRRCKIVTEGHWGIACCLLSNECQDEKWLAKGYQIIRIRYIFSITDQGNVLFVFPVIARKVPELLGAAGHILLNKSVIGPSVAISKTFVQCPAFAKIFTQYLHVVALTVYVDAVFFFFFF